MGGHQLHSIRLQQTFAVDFHLLPRRLVLPKRWGRSLSPLPALGHSLDSLPLRVGPFVLRVLHARVLRHRVPGRAQ